MHKIWISQISIEVGFENKHHSWSYLYNGLNQTLAPVISQLWRCLNSVSSFVVGTKDNFVAKSLECDLSSVFCFLLSQSLSMRLWASHLSQTFLIWVHLFSPDISETLSSWQLPLPTCALQISVRALCAQHFWKWGGLFRYPTLGTQDWKFSA